MHSLFYAFLFEILKSFKIELTTYYSRYVVASTTEGTFTQPTPHRSSIQVHNKFLFTLHRRDGVVISAFASQSVDLGFISQVESNQKTLKNSIYSFPASAQQNRDSVENRPASLLVFSGKALNGMPPSLCGRQMVGPSSLPVVVAPV